MIRRKVHIGKPWRGFNQFSAYFWQRLFLVYVVRTGKTAMCLWSLLAVVDWLGMYSCGLALKTEPNQKAIHSMFLFNVWTELCVQSNHRLGSVVPFRTDERIDKNRSKSIFVWKLRHSWDRFILLPLERIFNITIAALDKLLFMLFTMTSQKRYFLQYFSNKPRQLS